MEEIIARINELAKKAKATGLDAEEMTERDLLRKKYIESFKANTRATLDSVYVVDEDGNKHKLKKA